MASLNPYRFPVRNRFPRSWAPVPDGTPFRGCREPVKPRRDSVMARESVGVINK